LQPNGRFEVGKKICLTISAHHPESWQPSWSVRTALVALIGFFPTEGQGAIGALDYPDKERIKLARASLAWSCDKCHSHNATALPPREPASALVPPVQNEPNVIPERHVQQHQQIQQPQEQMQQQQQQQQQQSHGGAISATQLFVYLLVTCIVALILRKFLMAQGAPRVPIA
jgi:hypothetical protein